MNGPQALSVLGLMNPASLKVKGVPAAKLELNYVQSLMLVTFEVPDGLS